LDGLYFISLLSTTYSIIDFPDNEIGIIFSETLIGIVIDGLLSSTESPKSVSVVLKSLKLLKNVPHGYFLLPILLFYLF
jgi:hypothetical protein